MYMKLNKIIFNAIDEVKHSLMSIFDNLYFHILPNGIISAWVKTLQNRDGAAIKLEKRIQLGYISYGDWQYLTGLNKKVELARLQPHKYFYCSECGEVKPREEFADSVFATVYCCECAKKPEVAKVIEESKVSGFYD